MSAHSAIAVELATSKNDSGFDHARDLIRQGEFVESAKWSGPTATTANSYIEKNGWEDFGKWFLGKDPEFDPETKAHWKYPFTSDFKNVSINGLKAIRSRAGQTEETEIFNAAGKLLDMATEDKEMASALSGRSTFTNFCLEAQSPSKVDREAGRIEGISIISAGEAKGHHMMISQKTLESSITLLLGKSLPAYVSHGGASGDRLLTEAGYFSEFYRDKDKIRANKFVALESFKKYEAEKYERLFEIAEVAPESFGVSIVFEGQLFWEMADGSEMGMDVGFEAPENARFSVPTVRPLAITSADFVDTPAANGALFSGKVDNSINSREQSNMKTSKKKKTVVALDESASEAHEAAVAAEEGKVAPTVPAPQPKPKKKKKKLAEQDEEDRKDEERGEEDEIAKEDQGEEEAQEDDAAEDRDDDEKPDADELEALEEPDNEYQEKMRAAVEELYSHMEAALNRLREVMDMTGVPDTRAEASEDGESTALKARVEELEKLSQGTAPIAEKAGSAFTTLKDAKKHLINQHLEQHPGDSRSTAVLAIAKTNPELFKNN
jgi:hypothetical protein